MSKLNKSFSLPRITACFAVSLFMVTTSTSAQETTKKEKAEKTEKTEKSAKSEKSGKNTVTAQLSGDKQVPAIETKATGKSTIKVEEDKSVSGKVTVENMTPTAAHIHQGPPDKDGPVVIPLKKTSEKTFSVPANTKMTDEQFAAFKEGNLYINVHSKKYPSGEIRAQMKP
jgi:mannitol-specific phosphotransferase system IIBC component